MAHQPSEAIEMYLRTVLELEEEHVPPLRARLSERLELSAPAVSEGVNRLEQLGLAHLQPDRTIELTPEGREKAEHVMRKHRLAERLLVDVLGIEPEHVHEEACRWEHVISDRVEAKLVEFLGNPTTSPYGNPIPGSQTDGTSTISLDRTDADRVVIRYLSEHLQSEHEVVAQLDAHGMRSGVEVDVERSPDGVVLRRDGAAVTLDSDASRLVFVSAG